MRLSTYTFKTPALHNCVTRVVLLQAWLKSVTNNTLQKQNKNVRQPGIEPGSIAWKATMLTFTPPTLLTRWAVERILNSLQEIAKQ